LSHYDIESEFHKYTVKSFGEVMMYFLQPENSIT